MDSFQSVRVGPGYVARSDVFRYKQAAVQIVQQEIYKLQGRVNCDQNLGVRYCDIANFGLNNILSSMAGTVKWLSVKT